VVAVVISTPVVLSIAPVLDERIAAPVPDVNVRIDEIMARGNDRQP
jgi:hypothetical protein